MEEAVRVEHVGVEAEERRPQRQPRPPVLAAVIVVERLEAARGLLLDGITGFCLADAVVGLLLIGLASPHDCHAVMGRRPLFASGGCGPSSTRRHPPLLAPLRATAAAAAAAAEAAESGRDLVAAAAAREEGCVASCAAWSIAPRACWASYRAPRRS